MRAKRELVKAPRLVPRIRLSRISGAYVCTGVGASGSGLTMREAWESWKVEMILKGREHRIRQ